MLSSNLNRVLIVEDDLDTLQNLRDILELDGYSVECSTSIRQTLSHDDLGEFSSIILDRQLPDGTAEDLLPELREKAPEAYITIATAFADLNDALMALRHGASDFIFKPINIDLLRANMSRCQQLREAGRRALHAERLIAIGTVVAAVAHESRNALQTIRARVELMRLENQDNPSVCADLIAIDKAGEQLLAHFDELREYSAPMVLDREPCMLDAVIEQTWENVQATTDGIDAALSLTGQGCECFVDPIRIGQVFRNLFENSIAACPGKVRINVSRESTLLRGQAALRISIHDNGPGFTNEQRQRAFEPFYTTRSKGTGLGLAICRRIVESHGGCIDVDQQQSDGATLVIVLPTTDFEPIGVDEDSVFETACDTVVEKV